MANAKDKKGGSTDVVVGSEKAPELSSDALAKLTAKIQSGIQGLNSSKKRDGKDTPKKDQKQKNKPAGKGNSGKQGQNATGTPQKATPKQNRATHAENQRAGANSSNASQSESRGQKRGRDGNAKSRFSQQNGKATHTRFGDGKPKNPERNYKNNDRDVKGNERVKKGGGKQITDEEMLKEILELGGDKDDLSLVKEVELESDDEEVVKVPSGGNADKTVKSDIEKFMREIGLDTDKYKSSIIASEDEAAEDEEEENSSEAEDESLDGAEESDDDEEEEVEYENESGEKIPELVQAVYEEDQANAVKYPNLGEHKPGKLLFEPRPDWHTLYLPNLDPSKTAPKDKIELLKARGMELLKMENELYSSTHLNKSSDKKFLSTIMSSGTLSDKISALTLVCQESPLHTMKTLETLLGLAKKKSRSQAVAALGAIKDLFASGEVLPPKRKLKYFSAQHGLGDSRVTDMHVLVWAYEDWLKAFYFDVLKVLEEMSTDQLPYARSNAVSYIAELLKEKPEQEANLLRLLVNKLGDTDKKVSSKVSYLLLQIQVAHPAMKSIVIKSIETEVLFRPGQSTQALYYAVITLNQTILSTREFDVANSLIEVYFALFTRLLYRHRNEKDEEGDEMKPKKKSPEEKEGKKLSRKAKARKIKEEKEKALEEESNSRLVSAILTGVNRAFPYSKVDDDVFEKHMNTLFQITHSSNLNTGIQALLLIFQVSSAKQFVSDRFYRTLYESLLDARLVNSSKQAMYLNLLYKALKADSRIPRVKAFAKRLVQICTMHQPAFISGVLYLLSELQTAIPSLLSMVNMPEHTEDDEEEVFRDVPDEDDEGVKLPQSTEPREAADNRYVPRAPDPLSARADNACLWELLPFEHHFHPTISMYASLLLRGKHLGAKPDMGNHTLSHFLDRFVYRNPKANQNATRGQSIMQPLAGAIDKRGIVVATKRNVDIPVNDEAWWSKKENEVAKDEVFFHRYFNQKAELGKKKEKKKKDGKRRGDEDESADEDEIWEALVKSRPEIEAGSADEFDDDEDIEMRSDDDEEVSDVDDDDLEDLAEVSDMDDDSEGPDFEEDASDIVDSDAELPEGETLDSLFAAEAAAMTGKKVGIPEDEDEAETDKRSKRRKLKHLPTFAGVEEYAHLLGSDSE